MLARNSPFIVSWDASKNHRTKGCEVYLLQFKFCISIRKKGLYSFGARAIPICIIPTQNAISAEVSAAKEIVCLSTKWDKHTYPEDVWDWTQQLVFLPHFLCFSLSPASNPACFPTICAPQNIPVFVMFYQIWIICTIWKEEAMSSWSLPWVWFTARGLVTQIPYLDPRIGTYVNILFLFQIHCSKAKFGLFINQLFPLSPSRDLPDAHCGSYSGDL